MVWNRSIHGSIQIINGSEPILIGTAEYMVHRHQSVDHWQGFVDGCA